MLPKHGEVFRRSSFIPGNSCAPYIAATLGVAAFSYLPYAVFNFASPLLVIAVALTGIRMLRAATRSGT